MNLLAGFLGLVLSWFFQEPVTNFCRFEDGFYTCKILIKNIKKNEKGEVKNGTLEIQGCHLMHVKIGQKIIFTNNPKSPISFDDAGVVEIKVGEEVLVVEAGYEL